MHKKPEVRRGEDRWFGIKRINKGTALSNAIGHTAEFWVLSKCFPVSFTLRTQRVLQPLASCVTFSHVWNRVNKLFISQIEILFTHHIILWRWMLQESPWGNYYSCIQSRISVAHSKQHARAWEGLAMAVSASPKGFGLQICSWIPAWRDQAQAGGPFPGSNPGVGTWPMGVAAEVGAHAPTKLHGFPTVVVAAATEKAKQLKPDIHLKCFLFPLLITMFLLGLWITERPKGLVS